MNLQRPLLLCTLALAGLAAAQSADPQNAAKTVRLNDPALPFEISLPVGWVGVKFGDALQGINIASAPKAPAALMRFNFIPKKGQTLDLPTEFSAFENAVRQGGGTLTLLSSAAARYGGVGGLMRAYDLTQAGTRLRLHIWFGNGNKNFYNFQFTDQLGTFAQRLPTFDAALRSVQFR
ncbi:hypothetical protein [Deinococcus sp.]|uniref:hypothetical protein n=1 Tax=Deinococcus sp. TaxID=47478 RepID=UPI003CC65FB7